MKRLIVYVKKNQRDLKVTLTKIADQLAGGQIRGEAWGSSWKIEEVD